MLIVLIFQPYNTREAQEIPPCEDNAKKSGTVSLLQASTTPAAIMATNMVVMTTNMVVMEISTVAKRNRVTLTTPLQLIWCLP